MVVSSTLNHVTRATPHELDTLATNDIDACQNFWHLRKKIIFQYLLNNSSQNFTILDQEWLQFINHGTELQQTEQIVDY